MKIRLLRLSSVRRAPRAAVVGLVLALIFSSVGVTVSKAYCPMMESPVATSCSSCDEQDHSGSCCEVEHERLSLKAEYEVMTQNHVAPLFAISHLDGILDLASGLPEPAAAPVSASETPPKLSTSLERCVFVSSLRI